MEIFIVKYNLHRIVERDKEFGAHIRRTVIKGEVK